MGWGTGVVFGEPVAEHGGEPVGLLDVGEVPAVGEHREPPGGQQVHRGLGLVGGQDVVATAPDDHGRGGQGGEAVEQAGAAQVATGHPADHDGEFANDRQGVQGQQGVDLGAEAGAVDQGQRSDALWVGQGQA